MIPGKMKAGKNILVITGNPRKGGDGVLPAEGLEKARQAGRICSKYPDE